MNNEQCKHAESTLRAQESIRQLDKPLQYGKHVKSLVWLLVLLVLLLVILMLSERVIFAVAFPY